MTDPGKEAFDNPTSWIDAGADAQHREDRLTTPRSGYGRGRKAMIGAAPARSTPSRSNRLHSAAPRGYAVVGYQVPHGTPKASSVTFRDHADSDRLGFI